MEIQKQISVQYDTRSNIAEKIELEVWSTSFAKGKRRRSGPLFL